MSGIVFGSGGLGGWFLAEGGLSGAVGQQPDEPDRRRSARRLAGSGWIVPEHLRTLRATVQIRKYVGFKRFRRQCGVASQNAQNDGDEDLR